MWCCVWLLHDHGGVACWSVLVAVDEWGWRDSCLEKVYDIGLSSMGITLLYMVQWLFGVSNLGLAI